MTIYHSDKYNYIITDNYVTIYHNDKYNYVITDNYVTIYHNDKYNNVRPAPLIVTTTQPCPGITIWVVVCPTRRLGNYGVLHFGNPSQEFSLARSEEAVVTESLPGPHGNTILYAKILLWVTLSREVGTEIRNRRGKRAT